MVLILIFAMKLTIKNLEKDPTLRKLLELEGREVSVFHDRGYTTGKLNVLLQKKQILIVEPNSEVITTIEEVYHIRGNRIYLN